jgi:hypothetical protein
LAARDSRALQHHVVDAMSLREVLALLAAGLVLGVFAGLACLALVVVTFHGM